MEFIKRNFKRLAIDAAGYFLIIAALATGWLPGPGGIPLAIAGLGLLSLHNDWALRLREYLLSHSGKAVKFLFPSNRWVQWAYDLLAGLLLTLTVVLEIRRAAIWQISLGAAAFFFAGFIVMMNRGRWNRLRPSKHKQ